MSEAFSIQPQDASPLSSDKDMQSFIGIDLLDNPSGEGNCHADREHLIFMSLSPRPIRYVQVQDGKTHSGLYRKGDISIVPQGSSLFAQWDGHEQCLQLSFSPSFLYNVAQETLAHHCDRLTLQPEFQGRNPQIESISMMLFTEFQQGALGNRLYTDSLANVLAVHLLRTHATTRPHLPQYEGGLPQRQLMQVLDYIDAHLVQDIKLSDLARLVSMSQYHFSRLFKQSLGVSPYQYLIQQRVEQAKHLLRRTDRLIVDIALDCGFNSHSHLTKQFRQLTGLTPKAFRGSESAKSRRHAFMISEDHDKNL